MQTLDKQKQPATTATDGLFGMMLASAFMGFAYGAGAETAFKTLETTSDVYDDRRQDFKLGQKQSLGGIFTRQTQDWKDINPAHAMRPAQAAPAFRF